MSQAYTIRENNIAKAVEAYENLPYKSASACAKEFGISVRVFQLRLQKGRSKSNRTSNQTKLSEGQELALKEYVELLDKLDIPIRLPLLRNAANFLLKSAHPQEHPPRVGKNWVGRFLRRNPQFFVKKGKPLASERKNAHNVHEIRKYFEDYQKIKIKYGIADDDTWNMDETGFRIGCGRNHLVVTLSEEKRVLIVDPDNRDYMSAAECINGVGGSIPSFLILKGVNILHKWALENDLEDEVVFSTSESGYSNDVLAFHWLTHFDTYSEKTRKGTYRLLILDGYGSHLTYEFFLFAKTNNIILFKLPPHSTHLTQPLDVGIFQPLKHWHSEAIDDSIRMGEADFNRLDFLAAFRRFHTQAFKPSSIISAWKKVGLMPYDPDLVLDQIRALQPTPQRGRSPPPPAYDLPFTPRKPRQIIEEGEKIWDRLNRDEMISPTRLKKFMKGSIANANLLTLTERDVRSMHQHSSLRAARQQLTGTVVQKGGVVTVGEVRHNHIVRTQQQIDKVEKAKERAEAARKKRIILHGKRIARRFGFLGQKGLDWANERPQLIEFSYNMKEEIGDVEEN